MPFAVQWTGHLGPATAHRATAVEAIRFAIEMLGKGFADVLIVTRRTAARPTRQPNLRSLQERETVARRRPPFTDHAHFRAYPTVGELLHRASAGGHWSSTRVRCRRSDTRPMLAPEHCAGPAETVARIE
jgi:hypothetical protein